jgi:glycosyltransferase involved in cell wall biosynthesis
MAYARRAFNRLYRLRLTLATGSPPGRRAGQAETKNARVTSEPIHLLHVFPTFEVGGAQMRFSRLVKAHAARYRHTVIALDTVTDMASRVPTEAQITYRKISFDKRRVFANLRLFRNMIEEIGPDVLVTYNWGAIEWALANRGFAARKHVHIEDGFGPEEARRQLLRRVWTRRLALSGRHTTVVLPSRGLEKIALREWKLNPSRVRFIANGIDCERFSIDVASRRSRSAPLIVGTVATLRVEKNLPRLIEAFCATAAGRTKDELQLVIVGDGPEKATLEAMAQRSSSADQIRFVGPTSAPEEWLRRMDVFALSSDTEQMPFSVLEAMACGLPIVSLAVGDVPHLVAAENAAQIVPFTDEAGYRAALDLLLDDMELRFKLGRANQRKAREQFDESLMAARYAELFG